MHASILDKTALAIAVTAALLIVASLVAIVGG
jgi:hypothetical protein